MTINLINYMIENRANRIQHFRKQHNRCIVHVISEENASLHHVASFHHVIIPIKPCFDFALSESGANVGKLPLYEEKRILGGNLVFRSEWGSCQCQRHSSRNRTYVDTRALSRTGDGYRRCMAVLKVVTGGYRFGEWCTVRTCGVTSPSLSRYPRNGCTRRIWVYSAHRYSCCVLDRLFSALSLVH